MSPVEYSRPEIARRYAAGRVLDGEVLARWGAAVVPLLPNRRPLRVLDVGAGTGIFARAWPSWVPCGVVALEPAGAMRDQMIDHGIAGGIDVAAGRAQQIPLRNGSADVAWLSAVIHHLSDLPRCIAELRRVLRRGGVVLVRGLFADLGHPAGLQYFPGAHRAVGAFPSTTQTERVLSEHGFQVLAKTQVQDAGPVTVRETIERVRHLRHADTLLGQLTDDEISAGLATLKLLPPDHEHEPTTLGLLAFRNH